MKFFALIKHFFSRLTQLVEPAEEDSVVHDAKHGDMIAQYTLAFMYETGRGVQQSKSEAKKWYLKAAEQGHMGARQKLKTLAMG